MPEPAAWKYEKKIRPMFERVTEPTALFGRVLTCEGNEVIEDGFVELRDGVITKVGSRDSYTSSLDGVDVLELPGATILPGLTNSHAHLAWDGIHDLARQSMDDSPEISAYKIAGNMLISLRAGVTTVRDLGMNATNLVAKRAIEQGLFPGPRLFVSGQAIVQTGGHTYWCCCEASGPDEMRKAVREQVRGGADLIKIMACHDRLEFTDEELEAIIDETHRNGLPITAHATFDACIQRVARFGVDVIEHGGSMSQETIDLLLEKNIPIVTTFAPLVQQSKPEIARAFAIPEWKIEERQKAVADKSRYASLKAAAEAGVPIVFGTDAGSPAVGHDVVSPELAFMIDVGVARDTYDAIHAATSRAARLSGVLDRRGTLTTGKDADVIVVDGNPLADIHALDHVVRTYVGGALLHRTR